MNIRLLVIVQVTWASAFVAESAGNRRKPHIIFILADDLGWNDVGFHGSNQIPTPNIDTLAYTGITLDNYYVTPLCSPTRSALMTGKYPIHTGLQHGVITAPAPYGLGTEEVILPQFLKRTGYVTRAVGKWHLGHFKAEYTPERRGFDSHYGFWTGQKDYYDHSAQPEVDYWGYDMRRGMDTTWSDYGTYSTDLFTAEAVKIIKEHDDSNPLFLYIAHQAVHSANPYVPLQAPPEAVAKFPNVTDNNRRIYAGMLSKLDDSVGEVVRALTDTGMINDSIIIFSTDNGGPADGFNRNAASNWPLRGVKSTLWEGGVKGVGLIWSPLLPSGRIFDSLMHVTDWLPTLLHGIKAEIPLGEIDGCNVWESMAGGGSSPRKDVLLNIDPKENRAALILGEWKLIAGYSGNGHWDKWFGPSGRDGTYDWEQLHNCAAAKSLRRIAPLPPSDVIISRRNKASVHCNKKGSRKASAGASPVYLFNLKNDPCEMENLSASEQSRLTIMQKILEQYNNTMVKPRIKVADPRSNPKYWGYQWINWMDYV